MEDVGLLRPRPRRTKAVATFASTANKDVAEAVSTADNPSTSDEDVATLAPTVAEAVAKTASAADEDAGPRHGGTAEWRMSAF